MFELDYRENDYVSVALLYDDSADDSAGIFIELHLRGKEDFPSRFPVAPERASDAFLHPFVYEPVELATERMVRATELAQSEASAEDSETEIPV